jgi:hypothetical protein
MSAFTSTTDMYVKRMKPRWVVIDAGKPIAQRKTERHDGINAHDERLSVLRNRGTKSWLDIFNSSQIDKLGLDAHRLRRHRGESPKTWYRSAAAHTASFGYSA